jgi:uncharacterized protein (TIGR02646 family)
MIRVAQTGVDVPAALREKGVGHRERDRALNYFERAVAAAAAAPTGKRKAKGFSFKAYGDVTVKEALFQLFRGKCAYCESVYDATQPVDVEHWRPKGGYELDDGSLSPKGYYWLAAEWANLLPSCIDCNRRRTHRIQPTGVVCNIGKANQFPLAPGGRRAQRSDADLAAERALLLNPYLDEPEKVLEVDADEGVMRVRAGVPADLAERARASIEVYALNRTELVQARKSLLLRLRQRMHTIRQLARLLESLPAPVEPGESTGPRDMVEDLLTHELLDLHRRTLPDQPYSLCATQVVTRFIEEMTGRPALPEPARRG